MILHKLRNYLAIFLVLTLAHAANSKDIISDNPITIKSNSLEYHGDNDSIIVAEGDVKITQDNQTLKANKITYYTKIEKVIAEGDVTLLGGDGYVIEGNYIELHDKMKKGVITQFKLKFPDQSILWADKATRRDELHSSVESGNYTPCQVCTKCGDDKPQWKIRANKIEIDRTKEEVTYRNAFFDVYGIPVLYTPYFKHPTPGAKRKSGFLRPIFGTNTYMGKMLKLPYFYALSEDKDTTISPMFTSRRGMVYFGEFRHQLANGSYKLNGSITKPKNYHHNDKVGNPFSKKDFRSHFTGDGYFQINDKWSNGFNISMTSDKTYRKNYQIGEENFLTSSIHGHYFNGNDSFSAKTLWFQNLRPEGSVHDTPLVLPLLNSHIETTPAENGSKFTLDNSLMILKRRENKTDTNRVSIKGAWTVPYMTDNGQLLTFSSSIRADGYHFKNADTIKEKNFTGSKYRTIPELEINWKYPLAGKFGNWNVLLEPLIEVIAAPNSKYNDDIYNEDSQYIELTDSNIFSSNRFTGYDFVENGKRINYGTRTSVYGSEDITISLLLGQTYTAKKRPKSRYEGTGLEDNFSDFVGRMNLLLWTKLDFNYRFSINKHNMQFNRHELDFYGDYNPVYLKASLVAFNDGVADINGIVNKKEIEAELGIKRYKDWTFSTKIRKDLTKTRNIPILKRRGNSLLYLGGEIAHHGACVDVSTSIGKDYTSTDGKKPSTTWWFNIVLKNLG